MKFRRTKELTMGTVIYLNSRLFIKRVLGDYNTNLLYCCNQTKESIDRLFTKKLH